MEKILVVDDETNVRRVLASFLAKRGYEVLTASGGEEGILKARQRPLDLVLTDLSMPEIGGLEVVSVAKSIEPKPEVIVMTGHASVENAVQSMKLGACDFISKPFDLEDLDRLLSQVLEKRRQAGGQSEWRETDTLKMQFLATVSHELRTPLTSVIGYATLMLDEILGEISQEQRDALKRIGVKSDQLLALVNNMLDLSSLNTGQLAVISEEFDLGDLLGEVAGALQGRAAQKGLALTWEAPEGVLLKTDKGKLKKALGHLVENALKFTPQGSVSLAAEASEEGLRIVVRDTGIGIGPEQVPLLFADFRQLDGSMTRAYGGMGIGLSIAKKLLALLGGAIQVESDPGRGSAFTVSLPFGRDGGTEG